METEPKKPIILEDEWNNIFSGASSVGGEEEMLRIASQYASQYSAPQIKALLYLENIGYETPLEEQINNFIKKWIFYKTNNNSDIFIMKLFEYISLRKFFNENSFKVDIQK